MTDDPHRLLPYAFSRLISRAQSLGLGLISCLLLGVGPAWGATAVYHSAADDGLLGATEIPEGAQSVFLYIDGGLTASSGGAACNDGLGDEVCGFDLELTGANGLTLSSFTPDAGADLLFNLAAGSMKVNGLDTQSPTPGPHRIGELIVSAVAGGALELTSGEVVGASLGNETLGQTSLVTVPEPGLPSLVAGVLLLVGLARRRSGR